jgi:hypothetical protein
MWKTLVFHRYPLTGLDFFKNSKPVKGYIKNLFDITYNSIHYK